MSKFSSHLKIFKKLSNNNLISKFSNNLYNKKKKTFNPIQKLEIKKKLDYLFLILQAKKLLKYILTTVSETQLENFYKKSFFFNKNEKKKYNFNLFLERKTDFSLLNLKLFDSILQIRSYLKNNFIYLNNNNIYFKKINHNYIVTINNYILFLNYKYNLKEIIKLFIFKKAKKKKRIYFFFKQYSFKSKNLNYLNLTYIKNFQKVKYAYFLYKYLIFIRLKKNQNQVFYKNLKFFFNKKKLNFIFYKDQKILKNNFEICFNTSIKNIEVSNPYFLSFIFNYYQAKIGV
uniref:Uncharacterized protein orf287 n=1 Tax=Glaucocystis nostochinearum TaxID=38271 RepID=E9P6C2_9EUKA|nr:hypothetical protein GlnoM_p06 [Glaucocystis nostochinearum]ADW83106.1 hypothetical protein [Glaucocystis nostochinearum]